MALKLLNYKILILIYNIKAPMGLLRYLINIYILIKCYLERLASINDPENWTTDVA